VVGERRVVGRSLSASAGGRSTSANPGMSSEKQSENLCRRKPEVSEARFVLFCSGGPKPRLKSVGDGQTVDIPSPLIFVIHGSASVG
jgi:hypothetical protein